MCGRSTDLELAELKIGKPVTRVMENIRTNFFMQLLVFQFQDGARWMDRQTNKTRSKAY